MNTGRGSPTPALAERAQFTLLIGRCEQARILTDLRFIINISFIVNKIFTFFQSYVYIYPTSEFVNNLNKI